MADETRPIGARDDDELSVEELDEAAGGTTGNGSQCSCTVNESACGATIGRDDV